ncbi:MAG: hypothetical protein OXG49_06215 [Chloroflexi bacterium]|nr:hypothetical protein [Chloroflexota bacterium]
MSADALSCQFGKWWLLSQAVSFLAKGLTLDGVRPALNTATLSPA